MGCHIGLIKERPIELYRYPDPQRKEKPKGRRRYRLGELLTWTFEVASGWSVDMVDQKTGRIRTVTQDDKHTAIVDKRTQKPIECLFERDPNVQPDCPDNDPAVIDGAIVISRKKFLDGAAIINGRKVKLINRPPMVRQASQK